MTRFFKGGMLHETAMIMCSFGLALSATAAYIYERARKPQGFIIELCLLTSSQDYKTVLDDYTNVQRQGHSGTILHLVGISIKKIELVFYILIFKIIFKENLHVAPLIGQRQYNRRKTSAVVTLSSICLTHILRTMFSFIMLSTHGTRSFRYPYIFSTYFQFAILSCIEAVSVQETRLIFKTTLVKLLSIFEPLTWLGAFAGFRRSQGHRTALSQVPGFWVPGRIQFNGPTFH